MQTIFDKHYRKPVSVCSTCCQRNLPFIGELYGEVTLGRCLDAPSLAVREEHLLLGHDRHRFAHRIHLFEADSVDGAKGSYLGCLQVRPSSTDRQCQVTDISEAFLVPPARMLAQQYSMPLLSDLYTPCFGLLPFPCIPWAGQNDIAGFCAQTSVYMCLLMSVRHGGVARGPFTLTCQAKYQIKKEEEKLKDPNKAVTVNSQITSSGALRDKQDCDLGGCHPGTAFLVSGLNEYHMRELINNSDAEQGDREPLLGHIHYAPLDPPLLFYQTLYSYASSAAPVIAVIDPTALWGETVSGTAAPLHAVVIVGSRGKPWKPGFSIVYHDPRKGPYREAPAESFLKAARDARRRDYLDTQDCAVFLSVMPSSSPVHLGTIADFVECLDTDGIPFPVAKWWTIRLIENGHLEAALPDQLSPSDVSEFVSSVRRSRLPSHIWAVEFFESPDLALGHMPSACVFVDATHALNGIKTIAYFIAADKTMPTLQHGLHGFAGDRYYLHWWE